MYYIKISTNERCALYYEGHILTSQAEFLTTAINVEVFSKNRVIGNLGMITVNMRYDLEHDIDLTTLKIGSEPFEGACLLFEIYNHQENYDAWNNGFSQDDHTATVGVFIEELHSDNDSIKSILINNIPEFVKIAVDADVKDIIVVASADDIENFLSKANFERNSETLGFICAYANYFHKTNFKTSHIFLLR